MLRLLSRLVLEIRQTFLCQICVLALYVRSKHKVSRDRKTNHETQIHVWPTVSFLYYSGFLPSERPVSFGPRPRGLRAFHKVGRQVGHVVERCCWNGLVRDLESASACKLSQRMRAKARETTVTYPTPKAITVKPFGAQSTGCIECMIKYAKAVRCQSVYTRAVAKNITCYGGWKANVMTAEGMNATAC